MNFIKKVVVLKEICEGFSISGKKISGIARVECDNSLCTFYLSLINFSVVKSGEFFVYIVDGAGKLSCFSLGKRPLSFKHVFDLPLNVKEGVACGIVFVKDKIPTVTAFGSTESFNFSLQQFKKLVYDNCLNLHKKQVEKENADDIPEGPLPNNPLTPNPVNPPMYPFTPPNFAPSPADFPESDDTEKENPERAYDDEAVATENYFIKDYDLYHQTNSSGEGNYVRTENELLDFASKTWAKKSQDKSDGVQNASSFNNVKTDSGGDCYFKKVEAKIRKILNDFPKENSLINNLPNSDWVKIAYNEKDYYVVGVIYENSSVKYICYGVPCKYSPAPPKELKGFCSFIPLSVFDVKGDGYWMMFQDAISGECIKK